MIFQFSATTLVILMTTTITTTFAQSDRRLLTNFADIQDTNRAFNLAGLHFNLAAALDDNIAARVVQRRAIEFPFGEIFKRQTTTDELTPALSELAEEIDDDTSVQPQEQLGIIAPVAEVATAAVAQDVPSPTRNVKAFNNSGLRR